MIERTSRRRIQAHSTREMALCLDDDPLSLRLVEYLLKKRYEIISCATMEKVIQSIQKHHIDLFLCDYHLGERFTGADAFQHLRDEHAYNPVHRVLITSYPSPEIEEKVRSVGFDHIFAKPLRKEFQKYCLGLRMPATGKANMNGQ